MRPGKQFEQYEIADLTPFGPGVGVTGKQHPSMGDAYRTAGPEAQSPEQFREDPQTVFHASYAKFPSRQQSLADYPSSFPGIHAGTYQAAVERAGAYGYYDPYQGNGKRADGGSDSNDGENAKIVFHPLSMRDNPPLAHGDTGSIATPLSDEQANQHDMVMRHTRPLVYSNIAEDPGSLSVVFPQRPRNIQQSDWVKQTAEQNIGANRRADYGIHPRTWAMYKGGNLNNYDRKSPDELKALTSYRNTTDAQHAAGLFPFNINEYASPDQKWIPSSTRMASREEVADIVGKHRGLGEKFGDKGYPYHDREVHDSYGSEVRRSDMADAASAAIAEKAKWADPNPTKVSVPFIAHTAQRVPEAQIGLGDVRRGQQFPEHYVAPNPNAKSPYKAQKNNKVLLTPEMKAQYEKEDA